MNQIHWSEVIVIWESNKWRWTINIDESLNCDALVTKEKGIVLSVLVADCVPLLFYDDVNEIIWVAHAGWKWTNKEILKSTINKMIELWADISNIKVIIWPSISKCSYEIWEEVWVNFREEVKTNLINKKQFLDIKKENKLQALEMWIKENNIELINTCTFSDKNYFSARRDWFNKWRFWGFIYIK